MNLDLFLQHDNKERLLHGYSLEVFGLNEVSKKLFKVIFEKPCLAPLGNPQRKAIEFIKQG